MTFQQAQQKYSTILAALQGGADPLGTMNKLEALQGSLPAEEEYRILVEAINEMQGKLHGQITADTLRELKRTEAGVVEASVLLSRVATKANADARMLRLDKPQLVAAALAESVIELQELKTAANNGNLDQIATKVQALTTLFQQALGAIRA